MNITAVGETKGDAIWVGWNSSIWDDNVELIARQVVHVSLLNRRGLHIITRQTKKIFEER